MRKAAWLVPAVADGSGGHRTVFNHVNFLADAGYLCDVYIQNQGIELKELMARVRRFYGDVKAKIIVGTDIAGEYELGFATSWTTADSVRKYNKFVHKIYFVQDYESLFYPIGNEYILAENTYKYDLSIIAIGRWLPVLLKRDFDAHVDWFDFCADLNTYKPIGKKRSKAICFIYQPEKPRRCAELGLAAIAILKKIRPDVKIYLFGSKAMQHNIDCHVEHLGILTPVQCNELYNECSVGLCISSSNPSRVPFEMMASGLPVVDIHRGNNIYDLPDEAVSLALPEPNAIASVMMKLLDDSEKRIAMSTAGIKFMQSRPLEKARLQFTDAVARVVSETMQEKEIKPLYVQEAVNEDYVEDSLSLSEVQITKKIRFALFFHIKEIIKIILTDSLYKNIRSVFR